ncbi:hypothetical protein BH11GEM2_BH11GEM2_18970 [soil metagenome]
MGYGNCTRCLTTRTRRDRGNFPRARMDTVKCSDLAIACRLTATVQKNGTAVNRSLAPRMLRGRGLRPALGRDPMFHDWRIESVLRRGLDLIAASREVCCCWKPGDHDAPRILTTDFSRCGVTAVVALLVPGRTASAERLRAWVPGPHPTPRAGITGVNVITKEQLAGTPQLVGLFDSVRAIPGVIDGIRCNCGCAPSDDFYSLLSCYEGKDAMARECAICQGQGRLAVRLHKAGKSLDAIRAAVDAKFG